MECEEAYRGAWRETQCIVLISVSNSITLVMAIRVELQSDAVTEQLVFDAD